MNPDRGLYELTRYLIEFHEAPLTRPASRTRDLVIEGNPCVSCGVTVCPEILMLGGRA